jgi:hypothetical protein
MKLPCSRKPIGSYRNKPSPAAEKLRAVLTAGNSEQQIYLYSNECHYFYFYTLNHERYSKWLASV